MSTLVSRACNFLCDKIIGHGGIIQELKLLLQPGAHNSNIFNPAIFEKFFLFLVASSKFPSIQKWPQLVYHPFKDRVFKAFQK